MLGLASLVTLGTIFGFIFVVVLLAGYFAGIGDMTTIIGLTILFNALSWLLAPFFTDLMYRFLYKTRRLEFSELETKSKPLADFIRRVCEKHKLTLPKFRLIEDDNPTAFAFGSGVWNARLCFSEGLFTYLDPEEVEAVIGHELGHIRRRDFIVMTIAATGVQILYELSQMLNRKRSGGGGDKKGGAGYIALVAYVLYFVSVYLLLFLSRAREYGADEFSARETQNPDALSRGLVKIAYGIIAKPDDSSQQRLLHATRAYGPYDYKAAKNIGTAFEVSNKDWGFVSRVVAFDLISPWAKILEFQSTHPLTGKRIMRLNALAQQMGKTPSISTDVTRIEVDRTKLYAGFFTGVFIHFLPMLAPAVVMAVSGAMRDFRILYLTPAALGIAMLFKILYKYPETAPQTTTTLELMSDLYANPVRGKLAALPGTIIGRGVAGAKLSEDMTLKDATGLIYLNYESAFSFIGNFMFALGKVRQLIGQSVQATGWFFRDVGHHLDLKQMASQSGVIKSHPKLWGMVFAVILIVSSFVFYPRM